MAAEETSAEAANAVSTAGAKEEGAAAPDAEVSDAGGPKKAEDGGGDDAAASDLKQRKRKERLEQNRLSARESRKRKKSMIEELQRTVITLSRENKELNERNEQFRKQLMEIGAKVRADPVLFFRSQIRSDPFSGRQCTRDASSDRPILLLLTRRIPPRGPARKPALHAFPCFLFSTRTSFPSKHC